LLRTLAAISCAAPLVLSCRGRASPDQCREITDHYVDLAVLETPGASRMSPAEATAVREVKRDVKRAEPTYRKVQDRCEEVSRREVSCALDAKTTSAWEACLHPPDGGR